MKKTLMALGTMAALTAGGPALAADGTYASASPYFGAQLGIADVDGFDEGLMVAGTLGLPADHMVPNLAFEAELGMSLVDPERDVVGGTVEISYWYLAGFGVYNVPLNGDFKLRGKLGMGYLDAEADGPGGSASDSDLELMYGVGLSIPLRGDLRGLVEYTHVESDLGQLSAGVQFNF